jgi:hypothetical protein
MIGEVENKFESKLDDGGKKKKAASNPNKK